MSYPVDSPQESKCGKELEEWNKLNVQLGGIALSAQVNISSALAAEQKLLEGMGLDVKGLQKQPCSMQVVLLPFGDKDEPLLFKGWCAQHAHDFSCTGNRRTEHAYDLDCSVIINQYDVHSFRDEPVTPLCNGNLGCFALHHHKLDDILSASELANAPAKLAGKTGRQTSIVQRHYGPLVS